MQYTVNDGVSVCGAIIAIIQCVIIPFIIIKHIALHMSTPACRLLLPCCITTKRQVGSLHAVQLAKWCADNIVYDSRREQPQFAQCLC